MYAKILKPKYILKRYREKIASQRWVVYLRKTKIQVPLIVGILVGFVDVVLRKIDEYTD